MPQKFQCSHCGKDLIVLKLDTGKFAECPECKEWNEVPGNMETTGDRLNCIIKKWEHIEDILKRKEESTEEEDQETDVQTGEGVQTGEQDEIENQKENPDKIPESEEIETEEEDKQGWATKYLSEKTETYSPQDNIHISLDPGKEIKIVTFRDFLKQITPRIYATPALIIINVLVFLIMSLSGISIFTPELTQLIPWGIRYTLLILENGEWWRLFTSMFVHIGIVHLIINMTVLWIIGSMTERLYGTVAFALIYLVSGIGGNVAGFLIDTLSESAGASGAIMGTVGALIPFMMNKNLPLPRSLIQQTIILILVLSGISLMFGFFVPFIDITGHLGGFLTGFGIGFILRRSFHGPQENEFSLSMKSVHNFLKWRRNIYFSTAGLGVLLLIIGILGGNLFLTPIKPFLKIREYWSKQQYESALGVILENPGTLTKIPDGGKLEAIIYGNAGWENYLDGNYSRCIELSEKAYSIDPVVALYARYNIALCYLRLGMIEKSKALYLELENSDYRIKDENRAGVIQDLKDLIDKGVYTDEAKSILHEIFGLENMDV